MQSSYYGQVHEGMEVLDSEGDKIGMAGETLGNYFNVDAGFLGTKEYYVPFSAVTEIVDDQIFVNVRKGEIDRMGWDQRPTETTTTTAGMTSGESDRTIQMREEQLRVNKQPVETGSVQVGKDIVEEQRTMDVPVSREEVYLERHPVDRRPADQPISESGTETIRVPVREERVEVEKQPVVYEEVGVGKRTTQEMHQVSDTVRREELRVENEGNVEFRNNSDE